MRVHKLSQFDSLKTLCGITLVSDNGGGLFASKRKAKGEWTQRRLATRAKGVTITCRRCIAAQ